MFGYIVMNKPEIKMKDFDMYRTFYCGLCRELREKYGISGQITLSYDMTFVILLLLRPCMSQRRTRALPDAFFIL